MAALVGINGFGRIGRNILRAAAESKRNDVQVIAVNDLAPVDHLAHLLEFDSVHGRYPGTIRTGNDFIDIGSGAIKVTAVSEPEALPWTEVGIAMECTGRFTARSEAARHLQNGSERVLVSAPTSDADRTVVFGVNHAGIASEDRVVSKRVLHNQLPGADRQSDGRCGRHRARIHDHNPQLHRRPADAGRSAQGSVPGAGRRRFHDPDLDRRGAGLSVWCFRSLTGDSTVWRSGCRHQMSQLSI